MVVIKSKAPIRKVFYKTSSGPDEFVEGLAAAQQPPDPLEDERVQQALAERLEEARAEWEHEAGERERAAYDKGRAEGEEEARQPVEQRAAELGRVMREVAEARQRMLDDLEQQVLDLALGIARRFIRESAVLGDDLIKQAIKDAVKQITAKDKVSIRVNPDDLEEVRKHQDDIIFIGDGIGRLEIRGDKQVARGGCVVETDAGNIDARIDSRFEQIAEALRQTYSQRRAENRDEQSEEHEQQ